MDFSSPLLSVILALLALVICSALLLRWWRAKSAGARETSIHSNIQQMRAVGELSVYKVFTKEIVTETDHSWGEVGAKYLSWVLSKKKMAMVFEFEVDFRYNLRAKAFEISERAAHVYHIKMPPCEHQVAIRNITVYDEQKARVLPWLLPDLLNGVFSGSFDEQDKNRLISAARAHAEQRAREQIKRLEGDLHASAENTLRAIARAFGAQQVSFEFRSEQQPALVVDMPKSLAA